jgi:predicted RNA-binding protein with PUA-like domain
MAWWLAKSEPDVYSIEDLKREGTTLWSGVRNYQARNYLRSMRVGEKLFFYHSVVNPVGIAGIAEVCSIAEPDPTQFDPASAYFDPRATVDAPRWFCPRVAFVEAFDYVLPRKELMERPELGGLELLKPRSRLSVQPVSEEHFRLLYSWAKDRAKQ